MKKITTYLLVLLACSLCSTNRLFSQSIAINNDGSTAHSSAILDVKSTTKGLLVPRMNSLQRTGIGTPAPGLLVYDTDTYSYWFYTGITWSNLSAASTPGWLLTGNSTTNPATHFIGTSDNQPLRFRVNNTWAGELHPTNGNIFLGIGAGALNTGLLNIALGSAALKNSNSGNENVAIGDSTLYSQNGTGTNVAVGAHALFSNTTGNANTAIGPYSMYSNVDGGFNTGVGVNALNHNISGTENTAVGSRALQFNIGNNNTATGASSLRFNNTGFYNTANGYQALYSNTGGSYNTAIGTLALYSNTLGNDNSASGMEALYYNTTGNYNTATGSLALVSNTTGSNNTAMGQGALFSNNTGAYNTASGDLSLYNNTTGYENTAIGKEALYFNLDGQDNVAIGYKALNNNTGGGYNTVIGKQALVNEINGQLNIAIGFGSDVATGSPNVSNTINIGNYGFSNAASNQAFIGNMSTGWIGGHVTWLTYSDERIKKNIREEVKGLDFILRLRPVTYNKSLSQMRAITGNADTKDYPGKYDIEKIKFSGFIAQEVEKAANESGYDFDGVRKPQNEHDLYSLSYAEFVVPLVKAVQELSDQNISLKKQLILQADDILLLKKEMKQLKTLLNK